MLSFNSSKRFGAFRSGGFPCRQAGEHLPKADQPAQMLIDVLHLI